MDTGENKKDRKSYHYRYFAYKIEIFIFWHITRYILSFSTKDKHDCNQILIFLKTRLPIQHFFYEIFLI